MSSGKASNGCVMATCLRRGSTGISSPVSRPTTPAQGPAALTTEPAAISPLGVRTPEIAPSPSSSNPVNQHAVLEPDAELLGALDVAAQDLRRPDKPVGRAVHPSDEPLDRYRRVQLGYLFRPHLPRLLEPGRPLDALCLPQRLEPRLVVGQEEVPALAVAGVHPQLLLEAQELLAREQREPHVGLRSELAAKPPARPPGAAAPRPRLALEHHHGTTPPLGEVVGDARPDDTRPDNDYLGGPHAAPDRVASMFNLT